MHYFFDFLVEFSRQKIVFPNPLKPKYRISYSTHQYFVFHLHSFAVCSVPLKPYFLFHLVTVFSIPLKPYFLITVPPRSTFNVKKILLLTFYSISLPSIKTERCFLTLKRELFVITLYSISLSSGRFCRVKLSMFTTSISSHRIQN